MPNFKIAEPGHSFSEGKINLAWGVGRAESDVVSVPLKEQTSRFKQRVLAGIIVETKDRATKDPAEVDIREYKLMTGEEARAHKAIPAGPVTRSAFNPVSGELELVEVGSPKIINEQLEKAKVAQAEAEAAAVEAAAAEAAAKTDEPPEPDIVPDDPAEVTSPQLAQ